MRPTTAGGLGWVRRVLRDHRLLGSGERLPTPDPRPGTQAPACGGCAVYSFEPGAVHLELSATEQVCASLPLIHYPGS